MYRDSANVLDEHDRAVGAILIGEALASTCDRAAVIVGDPDAVPAPERWRAVADANDAYPEIWRHLDRARRVLAARGANTAAYDELRPHARRAPTSNDDEPAIDGAALDDARRAIAELKLAVPGADWDAIEVRTQGLVRAPLSRRRRQRLALGAVIGAFALLVTGWMHSVVPRHKPDRAEILQGELETIVMQRKMNIDLARAAVAAHPCDAPRARELAKLLAQDDRAPDARTFADSFTARCGGDDELEKWANAPRAHH
jgi:hypothetical protein